MGQETTSKNRQQKPTQLCIKCCVAPARESGLYCSPRCESYHLAELKQLVSSGGLSALTHLQRRILKQGDLTWYIDQGARA